MGGGTDTGDEETKKPRKKPNKARLAPSAGPTAAAKVKAIRARIDTKLTIDADQLVLTATGPDPGLTFDTSDVKVPGPYTLKFAMLSHASGDGELYWTTDATTSLPKGRHQLFQSLTMASGMRCHSISPTPKPSTRCVSIPAVAPVKCASSRSDSAALTAHF